jgi:hypothetical protein
MASDASKPALRVLQNAPVEQSNEKDAGNIQEPLEYDESSIHKVRYIGKR